MVYKGYEVTEQGKSVVIEGVRDFSPVHVFECGQCFRWTREMDGSYTGVVRGRVANIRYETGRLVLDNCTMDDFTGLWFRYLDLGRDYNGIKKVLAKDEVMQRAIEFGWGIRLLRQDLWETLVSFIVSSNNRIPKIMKTIALIAEAYGEELPYAGKSYRSFPEAESLAGSAIEGLEACRGGYRCKYILQTAEAVRDGIVDLESLAGIGVEEARSELVKLAGVGNKVADCTLLYSGTRYDVFPTDVWVKRVMEELYFKRETSLKEIQDFARSHFGEFAGFAQQYLFYYAREHKIGVG